MSDLDDALNSSAPMFDVVDVVADWQELPPGYAAATNVIDSLRDLGSQVGPNGYTVKQSFDDGLPDPVTVTTSNDASGSMSMDLVGRPGNASDLQGLRGTATSGIGSGVFLTINTALTGLGFGDYVTVAVAATNVALELDDLDADAANLQGWELLGVASDVTAKVWLFGRAHYTGAPSLRLGFSSTATYTWVAAGHFAATYLSSVVPIRPGDVVTLAEAVSGTNHNLPAQNLDRRGWFLGVWATPTASGPWAPGGTDTELIENVGSASIDLMMSRSALSMGDVSKVMNATTTGATAVVAAIGIPLRIIDRVAQDAVEYFSPFNEDSPIVDFERDTAPVAANVQVVTANGVVATNVFTGQMADIPVSGRTATLEAVSRTRVLVDGALTLPPVFGRREGCTIDWLASYVAARGGQYPGVAPSVNTRFWAPCHGSLHPHMDGPLSYANAYEYDSTRTPTGPYGLRYPQSIAGPFHSAVYAQHTNTLVQEVNIRADRFLPNTVPGVDNPVMADIFSQANSEGRMSFWIRGDTATAASSALTAFPNANHLMRFLIYNDLAPGIAGWLNLRFNPSTRNPEIQIDSSLQILTGSPLPSDGAWHFFGMTWKYATGEVTARLDNTTWVLTGFVTTPASLPVTDAAHRAVTGRFLWHTYMSHLPIAEIQLESGPGLFAGLFTRFWPTPAAPSRNMITRPTHQYIECVAEPAPIQGWTILSEAAQAASAYLRCNEADNIEFLPLEYFGELAQLTPETVTLDTETNMADPGVTVDPSLTRNSVTVQFLSTSVDSSRASVMDLAAALLIPKGITNITFALDVPTGEIHGALSPYSGTTWDLTKLTALQVAGTNPLPNEHFMSVNPNEDGSGTVYTLSGFTARIQTYDSSTVTIKFTNSTGKDMWLSNNGQQIPFLRILGYQIRTADAYSTVTDPGSIGRRRDRSLSTSGNPWLQTRPVAENYVNRLLGVLAQPRTVLNVRVMGDPRRKPGNLVTLADASGTKADGTWRVLAVTHNGNGPGYTQDLQLIFVPEVGLWDLSNWDEAIWGD